MSAAIAALVCSRSTHRRASASATAGDAVVITGRRDEPLDKAVAGLSAHSVVFDVADPGAVVAACSSLPEGVAAEVLADALSYLELHYPLPRHTRKRS